MEQARLSKSDNVVFSYRNQADSEAGDLFDRDFGWFRFMEQSIKLSTEFEFVVACDISEFYPRLGHLSYAMRVLAHTNNPDNQALLQQLYEERTSPLVRRDINDRNSAGIIVAVSNVDKLLGRVITKVVDIISKIDRGNEFEGITAVDVKLAFVTADKKLIGCGSINDTLRPGNTHAVNDSSGSQVDGFFAVVAESGDEQTPFVVDPEMVDAAMHAGKGHGSG